MKNDKLSLFAISIDSESLIDPPVWTKQVTPYSAQTSIVSGFNIFLDNTSDKPVFISKHFGQPANSRAS